MAATESVAKTGAKGFDRDTHYITTRITRDGADGYPVEPGRYRLVVARACPWVNRAIMMRRLLGLELFFREDPKLMTPAQVMALSRRPDLISYE